MLEKARKLTPLGAQTYSKSYRYFCENNAPSFMERGKGCRLWDVDGNEYIDFICALGPITIGYSDERINGAIVKQLEKGIIFSQPSPISIELAEKITEIIPCAEMVRFVKNGSDATAAAVRLARAYTGRELMAVSGYHGMQDWFIGSTVNHKGVPKGVRELVKNFEYNNIDSIKLLFEENPDQIAGVILEPIQGNGPNEGYLRELKRLVHRHGAILIFDEVVSGFRYALGGASELYNVNPDIITFGKGMANGMPISAVAGKKEILEMISEGVFISTTFGGEALSMAAALKTIEILQKENAYEKFWDLGNIMLKGIKDLVEKYKMEEVLIVSGLAPHCGYLFEGIGNLSYLDINSVYQQRMIEEGILTVGINNINLAHKKRNIQAYLDASEKAMLDIKKAIQQNSLKGILKGGKVDPVFKRV